MVRKNKFALEIGQILRKIVEYHSFHNVPLRRHLANSHGNRIKFGFEIKQLKPIHCSLFWYLPLYPKYLNFATLKKDYYANSIFSVFFLCVHI